MKRWLLVGGAAVLVILMALGALFFNALGLAASMASNAPGTAPGASICVTLADAEARDQVAGYRGEQLANAAAIINAAAALGLDQRAQTIGVMTAIGESSLRVLDHGDAVGPDSRGLFQQRANGAWGSEEDRMSPHISATNFYKALMEVDGWERMEPTAAAHAVQRNADPGHYARYWESAVSIVTALVGSGSSSCVPGAWVSPVDMTDSSVMLTSFFGWRNDSITGYEYRHTGVDFGLAVGKPLFAIADGRVVATVTDQTDAHGGYGNVIILEHAGGVFSRYQHLEAGGVLVKPGDVVRAGQQIGRNGNTGTSTAAHLHLAIFEGPITRSEENAVDPIPFFRSRGVELCVLPIKRDSSTASTC